MTLLGKMWKQIHYWLNLSREALIPLNVNSKAVLHRLLCVDDDKDLCLYLKKVASYQNVLVEVAYTFSDAKKKIEKEAPFEAFLIDGHLPDGSGFDLVAWVRAKYPNIPIIFLSRVYQDAASFRLLKEKFNVDYVLEKPLTLEKIDLVFKQLWRQVPLSQSNDEQAQLEAFIADIKRDYRHSIYEKLEKIEKLIVNLQRKPILDNLINLKKEIHYIGGSSGSYGFPEVGEICQALEIELDKQLNQIKKGSLDSDWLASLDDFFSQLKLYFQISPQLFETIKEDILLTGTAERPFVYLIHPDETFLKGIHTLQKGYEGLIMTESNPEKAKEKLISKTFDPQIVIVNIAYPTSSLTGFQLLETLYQRRSTLPIETGLIVKNIDHLAEELMKGIHYIFQQPLSSEYFYNFFKEIRIKVPSLHALILEKDSVISSYIYHSLNEIGIEAQIIQDQEALWELHFNERPHLFILDNEFVNQRPDLLSRLQNDERFQGIPRLLVASKQDRDQAVDYQQQDLIADLIIKPLNKKNFQDQVLILLKQHVCPTLCQSGTKLIDKTAFEKCLHQKFNNYQELQLQSWSIIALIELQDFSFLIENLSDLKQEELITQIGQTFCKCLIQNELCAYIREGVFTVLFSSFDLNYIKLTLRNTFSSLQTRLNGSLGSFTLKFNCGIALLPPEHTHISHLMRKAERALQYARQQPGDLIKIFALPEDQDLFKQKQLVLIGTGCHQLVTYFSEKGFKIHKMKSGQELLNQVFEEKNLFFSLLIVTDDLKRGEIGARLARELKNHYRLKFPTLVVHFFAEQEILHQLQRKALNYEEEPFNLMVLFQHDAD